MLKKALATSVVLIALTAPAVGAAASAPDGVGPVAASKARTSGLTSAQENAIRKAKDYLRFTAFSREGLIDQLVFERFSRKVATFAVDHIRVSWRNQAYKKAQSYLDLTAFSLEGLIDQLEFDGFTHSQAVYGARRAY